MTLKSIWLSAIICCTCTSIQAENLSTHDLVSKLKDGGYIVYIRHAKTETDYADQVTARTDDCSTQRVLSEEGWQQAKHIGDAFKAYNIPVGQVISSEYCRAWQTADLAFGHYQKSKSLNFEMAENYSQAQVTAMKNRLMPLLTQNVAVDDNKIIVGHDDPFEAATGIYPEPQGVAYVIKPNHGTQDFELLGHIDPDQWVNTKN